MDTYGSHSRLYDANFLHTLDRTDGGFHIILYRALGINQGVGDPLMTLPRYWDIDARAHLDDVRVLSNEAAAYAEQNKPTELEYYDIVCAPTYGQIPTTQ